MWSRCFRRPSESSGDMYENVSLDAKDARASVDGGGIGTPPEVALVVVVVVVSSSGAAAPLPFAVADVAAVAPRALLLWPGRTGPAGRETSTRKKAKEIFPTVSIVLTLLGDGGSCGGVSAVSVGNQECRPIAVDGWTTTKAMQWQWWWNSCCIGGGRSRRAVLVVGSI